MNFRLGINYWPISSAMYWWQRFEAVEVKRDFAEIRSAGFDSVRVFLLWEDFQPHPLRISSQAIGRLVSVADIAFSQSLALVPTFFTGHMSGVNWIPGWALESPSGRQRFRIVAGNKVVRAAPRNWYVDQEVIRAQALLAGEVAHALENHEGVWAWDLGNENSNCVIPPTRQAGLDWLERITNVIRSADPAHPITIGLHMEDLEEDRKLGPKEAAQFCDFLSMHGYPIYAPWGQGRIDALLLPYLGLITKWLGGKDVLFEEFGAPAIATASHEMGAESAFARLTEEESADFTSSALSLLNDYGLTGGFLWCYADYSQSLWQVPPLDQATHERHFGLWRSDRSRKPATEVVASFAGVERKTPHENFNWIDISPTAFYESPAENLRRLYRHFLSAHGH
jgi:endo-1,4-beta-mannosidase